MIYKFIYNIYSYLGKIWPDSYIALIFRKVGSFFKAIFSGSHILDFVAREGIINRNYEGSLLFRLVDGLLNLPQRLLHPVYKKAETVFRESFLFRVLLLILDKLHLLLAGFIFIALIIPHDYWNNRYSTAVMAAILFLYFVKTIVEGRTGFQTGAFNVFLVLFLVSVTLAEVFSIMPGSSLRFLAFYLTCFMLVLLLIATIRTKKDMSEALAVIFAGMTAASLYGVYQQIIHVPVNPAWVDTSVNQGSMTRVYSFFENPNNFAEIILLFLPLYFAALFNTKNALMRLVYLALACPLFLSLVFTQTRIAWIAFVITGFVYLFFKEKRLIPVFILLGVVSIPFLPQSVIMRLRTITNVLDSSITTRLQVWQTVLPILKDYWFTGLGLGNETLLRVSKNYYIFVAKGSIPSHSHNLYLQLWIETGLPGILTFFAFLGTIVKKSIRSLYKNKRNVFVNNILIAGLSALMGTLAIGMAEHVWFYPRVMLFFWAVIGIMLAALNIGANELEQTSDGSVDVQAESNEEEEDVAV